MSSNADVSNQPIDFTERRMAREARAQGAALTPEQQRAYRQLAIFALGLDLPTLTRELRARRIERMPELRLLPQSDRAA